jgi:hypothetical protein
MRHRTVDTDRIGIRYLWLGYNGSGSLGFYNCTACELCGTEQFVFLLFDTLSPYDSSVYVGSPMGACLDTSANSVTPRPARPSRANTRVAARWCTRRTVQCRTRPTLSHASLSSQLSRLWDSCDGMQSNIYKSQVLVSHIRSDWEGGGAASARSHLASRVVSRPVGLTSRVQVYSSRVGFGTRRGEGRQETQVGASILFSDPPPSQRGLQPQRQAPECCPRRHRAATRRQLQRGWRRRAAGPFDRVA